MFLHCSLPTVTFSTFLLTCKIYQIQSHYILHLTKTLKSPSFAKNHVSCTTTAVCALTVFTWYGQSNPVNSLSLSHTVFLTCELRARESIMLQRTINEINSVVYYDCYYDHLLQTGIHVHWNMNAQMADLCTASISRVCVLPYKICS